MFRLMEEHNRLHPATSERRSRRLHWAAIAVFLLLQGCMGTVLGTAVGVTSAIVVKAVTLPLKAGAAVVKAVVREKDKKKTSPPS